MNATISIQTWNQNIPNRFSICQQTLVPKRRYFDECFNDVTSLNPLIRMSDLKQRIDINMNLISREQN